ncbi:MAG: hypothetical protein M1833_003080 [Piccolia ochrophora]|nr:MAG: hypothetical protein M1833_003080 [Piccolia ochrophora]
MDSSLTAEEQKVIRLYRLDDFVGDLQNVGLSQMQKSRVQKYMTKLQPVLRSLDRFGKAFDVFSNADPFGALSLIWGSIRMVLVVGSDLASFCDDVVTFFEELSDIIGRLRAYEVLFQTNKRFNTALCSVFEHLLEFCSWLRLKMRSKSKSFAKMLFTDSLKREAAFKISQFRSLCIKTESEAQLAGAEASIKFQRNTTEFFEESRRRQKKSDETAKSMQSTLMDELHKKLAPIPVAEYLETLQRRRFQGTCSWIMDNADFTEIFTGETKKLPRVTWITGSPGSGKTFLSAYLIERLRQLGPTGYFFCDTKSTAKKDVLNILRTWAWQLCEKSHAILGEIVRMLGPGVEITCKVVQQVFSRLFEQQRVCYLVLDGIDECEIEDRASILDIIGELAAEAHVLIISRKEGDVEQALRKWERRTTVKRIQISARDTKLDVQRYVNSEADRLEIADPVLLKKIVTEVGNQAQGMFLYARLLLNELGQADTDEERYDALRHLPDGIDAVYNRSVEKIQATKPARKERLLHLLQWVICASRPLTIQELDVALAVTPNEDKFRSGNKPNVEKLFLDYCTSLLELDVDNQTLQCIHATAKDFLTHSSEPRLTDVESAHSYAASVCLTYLNYAERGFVERTVDTRNIPFSEPWPWFEILHPDFYLHLEENKFLRYSASNWIFHLAQTTEIEETTEVFRGCLQALRTLLSSASRMLRWIEIFHFLYVVDLEIARPCSDILDRWILEFEDRRLSVEEKNSVDRKTIELELIGSYSTFSFSFNGFPQVDIDDETYKTTSKDYLSDLQLKLLGPSWPDALSHLGFSASKGLLRWRRLFKTELMPRKPLLLASFFNYSHFLEDELQKGADPKTQDAMDRSVLDQAAWGESNEALKILVEHGADKNYCPMFTFFDGLRPLLVATQCDQFKPSRDRDYPTARYLLELGAKVESDVCPLNPLHTMFDWWMESESELSILNAILDHAEHVVRVLETPSPYNGMNPLHITARNDLPKTVDLFLKRHGDKKAYVATCWGADSKTALHETCYKRKSGCGPLLLNAGSDVNSACTVSLSTPLHIAALSRSDMLPKLLAAGADPQAKDASGRTCLHFAAMQDWADGLEQILKYRGDLLATDNLGRTALDAAVDSRSHHARRVLLDAGAKESDSKKPLEVYWPRASSDVFSVCFALKLAFRNKAPIELLSRIIDTAEYWLKSTSDASHPMLVQQADCGRPYLTSKPIVGNQQHPVRKMRVRIESEGKEGAYTALFPERRSWTWHELAKVEGREPTEGNNNIIPGPRLAENDIDVDGRQVHEGTYAADDDSSPDIALWVRTLARSESVCVLPMARWPERVNKVTAAKIELFTTSLRSTGPDHPRHELTSKRRLRLITDTLRKGT